MRSPGFALLTAALLLGSGGIAAVAGPAPPPPAALPLAEGIREPFFSLLVGFVESDLHGAVPGARLRAEAARLGRPTRLPLERIAQFRRDPAEAPGRAHVAAGFTGPLDLPIPYSILGYHPGRFRASPRVVLEEWDLGTLRLDIDGAAPAVLENVRLWGVREGRVTMDVDGWLDRLLGARLDDSRITGLAIFRYRGERIAVAMGYNRKGEGRSGAFRLRDDEIVFPNQAAFMAAGRYLRRQVERMVPGIRDARP